MADTTTARLALVKPEVGSSADTWGTKLNADLDVVDLVIQYGTVAKTLAAANVTLTDVEAASSIILLSGTLTASVSVSIPLTYVRSYTVRNSTTGAFTVTVKTPAGTGVLIPQGTTAIVFSDGTNISLGSLDINSQTSKTTPVDADAIPLMDSAAGNILKKLTWANLKATLTATLNTWSVLQTFTAATNEAQGANIASAGTTDIGAATGNSLTVTGTTTITALGTIQAGTRRIVTFSGILTLTHNATSLILPTAANITTAAGDVATFVSLGSGNWKCVGYERASGAALAIAANSVVTASILDANVTEAKLAAAVVPVGVGQTNQDVTASRALNTSYTNSTGRPIVVYVSVTQAAGTNVTLQGVSSSQELTFSGGYSPSGDLSLSTTFVVKDGATYVANSAATLRRWVELR